MTNILTVDVEDYFHPTEMQRDIAVEEWERLPSRVERNTRSLLEVLNCRKVNATFFVVGWVARRFPRLAREIVEAGHDIGCHSYAHQLVYKLSPGEFREDTRRAVAAIEDACEVTPRAYRAPSFSITSRCAWALDVLLECGFTHDSSIYPVMHDLYGIPGFGRHAQVLRTPSGPLVEVPPASARLSAERVVPVGGGGYLRLLPYRYTAAGIRRVNGVENQPACIYLHPWELDSGTPPLAGPALSRLRTYLGLRGMEAKINRLLSEFAFAPLATLYPSADGLPEGSFPGG